MSENIKLINPLTGEPFVAPKKQYGFPLKVSEGLPTHYNKEYFDPESISSDQVPNYVEQIPQPKDYTSFDEYLSSLGYAAKSPPVTTPITRPEDLERYRLQSEALKRLRGVTSLTPDIQQPVVSNIEPQITTDISKEETISQPIEPIVSKPIESIVSKPITSIKETKQGITKKTKEVTPEGITKTEEKIKIEQPKEKEEGFNGILKRMQEENKVAQEKENQIYEDARKLSVLTNFMGDIRAGMEKISAGMARVEGDPNAGKQIKKDAQNMMDNAIKQIEMSREQRKETKNLVKDAIEEVALRGKVAEYDPNSKVSELRRSTIKATYGKLLDPKLDLSQMNANELDGLNKVLHDRFKLDLENRKMDLDKTKRDDELKFKREELALKEKQYTMEQKYKDAQIEALMKKTEKEPVSPYQASLDRQLGKENATWATQGKSKAESNLFELKDALNQLKSGRVDTGGDEKLKAMVSWNPTEAEKLKALVDKITVQDLRNTFGAQFTQNENELFRALEFDISIPPKDNIKRLEQKIKRIEELTKEKDSLSDYMDTFNTAKGFNKYKQETQKQETPKLESNLANTDKVIVQDSSGKKYRLPKNQLESAIRQGYKLVE